MTDNILIYNVLVGFMPYAPANHVVSVWRLLCPACVRSKSGDHTPDDKKIEAMSKMSIESNRQNGKNADRAVVDVEWFPFQVVHARH